MLALPPKNASYPPNRRRRTVNTLEMAYRRRTAGASASNRHSISRHAPRTTYVSHHTAHRRTEEFISAAAAASLEHWDGVESVRGRRIHMESTRPSTQHRPKRTIRRSPPLPAAKTNTDRRRAGTMGSRFTCQRVNSQRSASPQTKLSGRCVCRLDTPSSSGASSPLLSHCPPGVPHMYLANAVACLVQTERRRSLNAPDSPPSTSRLQPKCRRRAWVAQGRRARLRQKFIGAWSALRRMVSKWAQRTY